VHEKRAVVAPSSPRGDVSQNPADRTFGHRGVWSKTMMISGPVSNAAQGGKINPWFGIVIGGTVLVTNWTKYLKGELRQGAHLGILLGISAICILFIGTGLWELLH
jgi:hypothetical protein